MSLCLEEVYGAPTQTPHGCSCPQYRSPRRRDRQAESRPIASASSLMAFIISLTRLRWRSSSWRIPFRTGLSGRFLRSANLFNSVGLIAISGYLLWRVIERLSQPIPVLGLVPIIAGLLGAVGNWGVARVLREPSYEDAAIRLAYVHNLGDTFLSLAPVAAGGLVLASGQAVFDPVIALIIAGIILVTTIRSIIGAHQELLWPENVMCSPRRGSSN